MNELEEGGGMCAPDPAQRKCVIISMSTYLACLQGCNQGPLIPLPQECPSHANPKFN